MLPSNKRWLRATSASCPGDGAASSSSDPSAWAYLSQPRCSQLGERAPALLLLLLQPLQGLGIVPSLQSTPV